MSQVTMMQKTLSIIKGFKKKKRKCKSKSKIKSTSDWWEWLGVLFQQPVKRKHFFLLSGEVAGCDVTAE